MVMNETAGAPASPIDVVLATEEWQRLGETAVRWDVFVVEQGVAPVLEIDARDYRDDVAHVVAVPRGSSDVIGTARIIPDAEPGHYHLGRIAVRREWRGAGVGALLVMGAHRLLKEDLMPGESVVVALDAQIQARGFYERLGYEAVSEDVFLDAGIPHVTMAVELRG